MNRFLLLTSFLALFAPDDGKGGGDGKDKEDDDDKILRMVNAAVSSQLGRKLESTVNSAISAAMSPILEKLSATPNKEEKAPEGNSELQAQIDALKAANAEKDELASTNNKKHREEQLIARIREGLGTLKVKPELMDGAVLAIRKKMSIDEKGDVSYNKQNKGWNESLTVDAGLKDWGESDVGKAHMAPISGGGAGTTPIGGPLSSRINPATLPTDPTARKAALKAHKIAQAKIDLRKHTTSMMSGGRITITGSAEE